MFLRDAVALVHHDSYKPRFKGRPMLKLMQVHIGVNKTFLHQVLRIVVIKTVAPADLVQVRIITAYQNLEKGSAARYNLPDNVGIGVLLNGLLYTRYSHRFVCSGCFKFTSLVALGKLRRRPWRSSQQVVFSKQQRYGQAAPVKRHL